MCFGICVSLTQHLLVRTGESMVRTEESMVRTAESMIRTGESMVRTGESMVRTGESMVCTGEPMVRTGDTDVSRAEESIYTTCMQGTAITCTCVSHLISRIVSFYACDMCMYTRTGGFVDVC